MIWIETRSLLLVMAEPGWLWLGFAGMGRKGRLVCWLGVVGLERKGKARHVLSVQQ